METTLNPFICNSDAESKRSTHEGGTSGIEAVNYTMGDDDRAVGDQVLSENCGATEPLEGAKIEENNEEEKYPCGTDIGGLSTLCSKARILGI